MSKVWSRVLFRFLRSVATMMVFILIGPVIGMLTLAGNFVIVGEWYSAKTFVILLFFGSPFIYFFGGPAALITGLVVAVASQWIAQERRTYVLSVAAGAATGMATIFVLGHYRLLVQSSIIYCLAFALAGAVAAAACTLLTWPFRVRAGSAVMA